ncbi:topoisomerase [Metasolibacillus meyeri]|uniref:Topoisomerase n=1 Tax=Metasolibacillus meyeri TaxID=1071052 RepID=A0AAW9NV17_9BACL|nr:topoisomerase [Metasolibacillus meyeri]MEC1178360.1 topoisomerase [Metasolibacillus meyeri]
MLKKAIISGIVFSSILLVGCNENEEQIQVVESKQGKLLSELKNKIIASITEQTELDSESIAIMLGGNVTEISVSVGFPKDVKVDDTLIQQIVRDSIKNVSETENVTISEENITIKIEKY